VRERFWAKVEKLPGGCWLWTGTAALYFKVRRGQVVRAHRFAYELLRGPVGVGLDLVAVCGDRRCVNPGHMARLSPEERARRARLATLGVAPVVDPVTAGLRARGYSPGFVATSRRLDR
jgi:hypothetical protein